MSQLDANRCCIVRCQSLLLNLIFILVTLYNKQFNGLTLPCTCVAPSRDDTIPWSVSNPPETTVVTPSGMEQPLSRVRMNARSALHRLCKQSRLRLPARGSNYQQRSFVVVENRDEVNGRLVVGKALDADGALAHSMQARLGAQKLTNTIDPSHAFDAGCCQDQGRVPGCS